MWWCLKDSAVHHKCDCLTNRKTVPAVIESDTFFFYHTLWSSVFFFLWRCWALHCCIDIQDIRKVFRPLHSSHFMLQPYVKTTPPPPPPPPSHPPPPHTHKKKEKKPMIIYTKTKTKGKTEISHWHKYSNPLELSWPLLATITAWSLLGSDATSSPLMDFGGGGSVRLDGDLWWTAIFRSLQRYTIGFNSRLCLGRAVVPTLSCLCACSHCLVCRWTSGPGFH